MVFIFESLIPLSNLYVYSLNNVMQHLLIMNISGMDPIAKRFMWEVISHLSTRQGKTAVILTTHSMNEAQALCTRIGIMVSVYFLPYEPDLEKLVIYLTR